MSEGLVLAVGRLVHQAVGLLEARHRGLGDEERQGNLMTSPNRRFERNS